MSPTWRCASHQLIVFLKEATFETHFPSMFDFYSKELYVQMYACMHLLCSLHYWIKIVLIPYSTFGSCNASLGIQTTKTTPTLRRNKNVLYNTELNLSCTCKYYIRPLIHIYRRFHGCLNHCFFHIRYYKLTFLYATFIKIYWSYSSYDIVSNVTWLFIYQTWRLNVIYFWS